MLPVAVSPAAGARPPVQPVPESGGRRRGPGRQQESHRGFILSVPVLVLEFFLQFQGTLEASVNHPFCFPSGRSRLASFWSGSCTSSLSPHPVPLRRLPWRLSALTHSTAALLVPLAAPVCLPRWCERSGRQGSSPGLQGEPAPLTRRRCSELCLR